VAAPSLDVPDVNVWLALSVSEHPYHGRAERYWRDEAGETLAFCRVTSLGLLRLLTNERVMGGQPLAVAEAWAAYQAWRQRPEVVLAPEPVGCETRLADWARRAGFASRLWTDAYLAAFARAGDWRIVTFDRDFSRFEGVALLHLGT
jgi:toxin-antitoxin system PIN domain toxin